MQCQSSYGIKTAFSPLINSRQQVIKKILPVAGSQFFKREVYSPHISASPFNHFFTRSVVTDLGLSNA